MQKSQIAANRFLFLIKEGIIRKNILPNSSCDYTGDSEKKDYERYLRFINSSDFDEFKRCKVRKYNGE